jgi:hypothetical protein
MRNVRLSEGRSGTTARLRAVFTVGLVVLAGSGSAVAADPANAAPGSRVRVTTASDRLVGRFVELRGETLVLARDAGGETETLRVDRREVVGIELSERGGRRRSWAARGALAGVLAAIAVGIAAGDDCSSGDTLCFDHATVALGTAIVAVPAGALVGAAVAPGERWRPVPVEGLSVQPVAARGGGVGVRVAIGF